MTTDASNLEQKYASNKTEYMANQTMYGLVQCTRDLIAEDCKRCLESYVASAIESKPNCSDQLGARIMGPNCYIRYELYSFNVATYTANLPSPPLPLPPPSTQPVPAVSPKNELRSVHYFLQGNVETNVELILHPNAEYQVFDLDTLRKATYNFSEKNKLGQGGFGPVYKGTLPNGENMAVKRLCGSSAQGLRELKNEVQFLAKLKHKNLVQLIGCCIQNKEHILCYEFLPNGSLDKILFSTNYNSIL
ncbi:cysteine-rich RECEPTOR-like kinase [Rhynchospora pubera]|uniref:Cysteine-rich RECEPTOR-like kinase n=1 Tax=Rhynchospora pubera TaxID=906938 RepID=A0AAV8HGU2_9POAL|nr:cysteine-rich RECEPTOR-like kinase [Rhynchospora pubera]